MNCWGLTHRNPNLPFRRVFFESLNLETIPDLLCWRWKEYTPEVPDVKVSPVLCQTPFRSLTELLHSRCKIYSHTLGIQAFPKARMNIDKHIEASTIKVYVLRLSIRLFCCIHDLVVRLPSPVSWNHTAAVEGPTTLE